MRQFRTPKPGDKVGRAADLRALADEVERLGKFSVEGAILHDGDDGRHLIVPGNLLAFWARLTSEGTGPDAGRYAWIEQERSAIGTFRDLQYGRTGTVMLDPAIEAQGTRGLKTGGPGVGLYVWLVRSYGEGVQAGVKQEWLFQVGGGSGERTGVARITGPQRPDRYYPARLGQGTFNTTTRTFASGTNILLLDAVDITIPP